MTAQQKASIETAIAKLQEALLNKAGWDRSVLDATAKLTTDIYA